MKKSFFFWLVFLYVLLFLVIAPIVFQFFVERNDKFVASYPFSTFLLGGISFLIYISALKGKIFEKFIVDKKLPFFIYSSNALITFGFLCLSSVIFELIAFFAGSKAGLHSVVFPAGFLGKVDFVFGVIFAAFFEEVIYRFYLPRALKELLFKVRKNPQNEKINLRLSLIAETASLILFALPHLYLGFFGFLNALVCGIILRVCMLKTKMIWISFAVHALYNFLSFAVMAAIA